jgi:NADH-quinone oxidoreductase subunit J
MTINLILLIAMTFAALWTVMTRSLLKSTIGLAVTSTFVTILMFRLSSPLAAVFELSVCTGLITAVFVSAISLTKPLTHAETIQVSKDKLKRYWPLPIIMLVAAAVLVFSHIPIEILAPKNRTLFDVRQIMWQLRQLDMLGQMVLMLAGAFGVVILFKEKNDDQR